MANKLYAPILDGTLPAQCNGLNIPFQHNLLVEPTGIMWVKLKNITTNTLISTQSINNVTGTNIFLSKPNGIKTGEYYKVQIAYGESTGQIGYYSTVGVFKYIGNNEPQFILDLTQIGVKEGKETKVIDLSKPIILSGFTCDDSTEKEFSYQIDLILNDNTSDKVIYSSGELLHNPEMEYDEYYFNDISISDKDKLIVRATIKTSNLYTKTITKEIGQIGYKIPIEDGSSNIKSTTLNVEDGLINLEYNNGLEGNEKVYRWCWEDNKWTILGANKVVDCDRSVEQGKSYSYMVENMTTSQEGSESTNNNISVTPRVKVDFEDIFLSDKDRQLAIRYNPAISNFREVVNDSKVDTLGSQYPFIIRNGDTKYKEFSLSGLIMAAMDENELFFSFGNKDTRIEEIRTSTYATPSENPNTPENREYEERIFKLKVLEWLNNGEVKLLRTGREGNYLVRLTDISLTPETTSARLFHNFSCTATEIAECNNDNLKKYIFPDFDNYVPFEVFDDEGAYVPFEVLV